MKHAFLEAFIAIAVTKSLTRAAEQLNITQSTVSYRLKQLEDALGSVLIHREPGSKEARLTVQGEKFLKIAVNWLTLSEEIKQFKQEENHVTVHIGAIESLNLHILPPLYQTIARSGYCKLDICNLHSREIVSQVANRRLDLGLITDVTHKETHIQLEELLKEDIWVAGRSLPPPSTPLTPEMLDGRQEIYIEWGWHYHLWRQGIFADGLSGIRCDSLNTALPLLEHDGWMFVPTSLCRMLMQQYGLMCRPLYGSTPWRRIFLVSHNHIPASKNAALEHIKTTLRSWFADFSVLSNPLTRI
ncbi:LysR family transcriptional regulator [Neisseria animalis]|uniref:LysR family transcriptional regulator n=1 Tax=Neisseria animalis TaxID=492 RepID=A0A5P3MSZ1_NEIAN|nr:LysR family transcriptional regulator [Neisseria animalis]QEY24723.1 LysR family transcriptional regulator [Neisseria animalis]ROW31684.1 LysR family transcriptional regulator [Neisseria animalis]VEE07859.1 CysJI operon transcriptional activator [Neisseria animalis]